MNGSTAVIYPDQGGEQRTMINASLENNFGIVRKVIDWSLGWEMYATEHGQPPTDEQLADAEQVGVAVLQE